MDGDDEDGNNFDGGGGSGGGGGGCRGSNDDGVGVGCEGYYVIVVMVAAVATTTTMVIRFYFETLTFYNSIDTLKRLSCDISYNTRYMFMLVYSSKCNVLAYTRKPTWRIQHLVMKKTSTD